MMDDEKFNSSNDYGFSSTYIPKLKKVVGRKKILPKVFETKESIDKAIKEFLKKGGKIKKITLEKDDTKL